MLSNRAPSLQHIPTCLKQKIAQKFYHERLCNVWSYQTITLLIIQKKKKISVEKKTNG